MLETDRLTGRTRQIQQHVGGSPAKAFEKLLLDDAAADVLAVPRDVRDAMRKAVAESEAIWKAAGERRLDAVTAERQIRSRLKRTGMRLDSGSGELTMTRTDKSGVMRKTGQQAAKAAGGRAASALGGRFVGGGVAGAVFVGGETLIEVFVNDKSFLEVADTLYGTVAVIAVTEAAVFGAEWAVVTATGMAVVGGPAGFALAVGIGATVEGTRYAWTFSRDLKTSEETFLARCDVAKERVRREYDRLAVAAVRATTAK